MAEQTLHVIGGSRSRRDAFALREIVILLYRRRWLMLAVALPIILIGASGLLRQTKEFTASTKILIELAGPEMPRWDTRGANIDYNRELSTYENMAMSVPVAEMAAENLADSLSVIMTLTPKPSELRLDRRDKNGKLANLVEYILNNLQVSAIGESNILDIRCKSVNLRMAMMAARACRDAFMEYSITAVKNPQAVDYYQDQIGAVTAKIDSLLSVRTEVMNEAGYSNLTEDTRYEVGQMTDLESQYYETVTNRKFMENRIANLRASVAEDPRFFPMGDKDGDKLSITYLKNQVSKHENTLNELLGQHPADSVPVRRQREILDRAIANLKTEVDNYIKGMEIEAQAMREKEASLSSIIEQIRRSTQQSPNVYHRITLLDAEINAARSLMEDLQVKLGEVRLNSMADERISRMIRLTEPESEKEIAAGQSAVYFGLVCFFALGLGIIVAFTAEGLDHRIYNRRQAEQNLELPVFASISRVK